MDLWLVLWYLSGLQTTFISSNQFLPLRVGMGLGSSTGWRFRLVDSEDICPSDDKTHCFKHSFKELYKRSKEEMIDL